MKTVNILDNWRMHTMHYILDITSRYATHHNAYQLPKIPMRERFTKTYKVTPRLCMALQPIFGATTSSASSRSTYLQ